MATQADIISSFIQDAPPGQLDDVVTDIKSITGSEITPDITPAFEQHNHEQFATVKLPGSNEAVVISAFNALGDGRYYDVASSCSFQFDHVTQKASGVQSYVLESSQSDLVKSIIKSLESYIKEHYTNASYGVYPVENDSKVAIIIVSNKYSPRNYWSGRWRSQYIVDSSNVSLEGFVKVDVHYYEDGNVRLQTNSPIKDTSLSSSAASAIVHKISTLEAQYQEELNKSIVALSQEAFKGLRRQLPVTRQKIEWDRVAGYRLGQDIGGGSSRR